MQGLSPTYSRILVREEGPNRTIERVRLDDIRQALDEHPTFILLAQPGAGKTTVLQRLALELALKRLQKADDALLRFSCAWPRRSPTKPPLDFLARMWREEAPGLHTDPAGEIALALQQGRLCLLCDALNEARREKYRERMLDWADFARNLPAGNRLVFTCRTQDYSGELAVQQVEVDPLTPQQIQGFARSYLGQEQGAAFWRELRNAHADLLDLATIPYYLLLMTEAYAAARTLPSHRAGLFASFVERLFRRKMEEKRHPDWVDAKPDVLLAGQAGLHEHLAALHASLLARFEQSERQLVAALTSELSQERLGEVDAVLAGVDALQAHDARLVAALESLEDLLAVLSQAAETTPNALPAEIVQLEEVLGEPTLDLRHKLKLAVPIIPWLLTYEGEVDLGGHIDLEAAWQALVTRFRRR